MLGQIRRILLVGFACIALAPSLFSQGIELGVFTGYSVRESFPVEGGRGKIFGAHTPGVTLTVPFGLNLSIEALYSRQSADLLVESDRITNDFEADVVVNYFQLGISRTVFSSDMFDAFSALRVGATTVTARNGEFDRDSRFAATLSLGVKTYILPKVGVRVAGELGMPVIQTGTNIGWSPGSGPTVGVTSWSPIIRFSFQAGVFFNLTRK